MIALARELQHFQSKLKDSEDRYKNKTDNMVGLWHGSSGICFAEASGRVQAGFAINRAALEQLVFDVNAVHNEMTTRDNLAAGAVGSM